MNPAADTAPEDISPVMPSEFDNAFAELAALRDDTAEAAEDAPEEEPTEEPEVAEAAEDAPEEEPTGEPEAEAEEPAPEPREDPVERLARLLAEQNRAPEPQEAQQPEAQPEPEIYTAEEKKLLEDYRKDWPDVAKAEALSRRQEYHQLVQHVFTEVSKALMPINDTVQTLSERSHLQELESNVEDYGDIRDKVVEWVETQPAYLQNAYNHVIEQGTATEVVDLIERYRRETGATAPTAAPPATAPRKKERNLPEATKKAVASLAPVSSKRSVIPSRDDPNDFDGAFASFADKI